MSDLKAVRRVSDGFFVTLHPPSFGGKEKNTYFCINVALVAAGHIDESVLTFVLESESGKFFLYQG